MSSKENESENIDSQTQENKSEKRKVKIGDIGKVVTGGTPSTKDEDNYGGDFSFIRVSDFNSGPFIESTGKKLTEKGKKR